MRILINSDILFTSKLVTTRLPLSFEKFATECARVKAILVFPRTTLLEVERRQQQLVDESVNKIANAYAVLRNLGIPFEERDPAGMFGLPDFVDLFRRIGVTVEIEEPTLQDFADAHRRACLHLSPQPPDTKYDEMRDLVIWVIALRVALRDGGAILLSRDEVHTHARGSAESEGVRLLRAKDIDEALELLGVESPAGKLARLMLEPIWEDLRAAGLPLLAGANIRAVKDAVFVQGQSGIEKAEFDVKADADNEAVLTAKVEISCTSGRIIGAELRDIQLDNEIWNGGQLKIRPDRAAPIPESRADEALGSLRDIIGE